MKEPFIVTLPDLKDFAASIVRTLSSSQKRQAKIIFLEGDLGAGKTTFTKHVAHELGIDQDEVSSPTFILKRTYKTEHDFFRKLIHIDAYRFDNPNEIKSLGLATDILDPENLIMIEWPSKLDGTIQEDMVIAFDVVDDETREITVNYTNNPFRL